MTTKFLAIGECMVELAPKGDELFGLSYAGDTFNTAWYMQQVAGDRVDVAYYSAVGDDPISQKMADFIAASGITPMLKTRAGRSVGLYMVSLNNGERSFSYWRSAAAARTLADDMDDVPLGAGDIAYFSGITLAILPDESKERLLAALNKSKARGATIVFDSNLRPKLWDTVQQMRDWTMKGAAVSDICLPSFDDEAAHFGDISIEATSERYAAEGAGIVVVKNGSGEILVRSGSHQETVMPVPVQSVVDTTAAGDSFNAQFLNYHVQGASLAESVKAACNLSGKVIGATGALVRP